MSTAAPAHSLADSGAFAPRSATAPAPLLSESLLRRHDIPGPRYTSYPTADRFSEVFGAAQALDALAARAQQASRGKLAPLSVYVHIPFCEQLCYYCACNKVITRHHERAAGYLQALQRELDLQLAVLGAGEALSQLHFGGGSPTFLSDVELASAMAMLRRAFALQPDAELSIEVDPRTVDAARLAHLKELGFNRISFGVQDFDPDVQQAVHRIQPYESVDKLMRAARAIGFASINVDLIYGLPRQTPASFERTISQVAGLRPDRIALYAYAHLPQRFKPQRRIHSEELPPAPHRIQMLGAAIAAFQNQGYAHIGMDHFALHGDALAVAKREGRLHRNFQGYSTQPDCDLIALGVSSIGKVGNTYSQNVKTVEAYEAALSRGELPVERGLRLSADDVLRRDVIMAIMCQGRVEFETIERAHGIRMREYFAAELNRLEDLGEQGLVSLEPRAIQVTPTGWYLVRAVASAFDRYLSEQARERFSRIV